MREFDFGFSLVDENELETVQTAMRATDQSKAAATEFEDRLNTLYNSVQPLLNNLKANPEKEYIFWPDRTKKIEEFSDYLDKIYHGEV